MEQKLIWAGTKLLTWPALRRFVIYVVLGYSTMQDQRSFNVGFLSLGASRDTAIEVSTCGRDWSAERRIAQPHVCQLFSV